MPVHGVTRRPGQKSVTIVAKDGSKKKLHYNVKVYRKITDEEISRVIEGMRKKEEREEKELLEKHRIARITSFVDRAKKVGLIFTPLQAEFLLEEFASKEHEHNQRLK